MPDFTPEDIAAAAARGGIALPSAAIAQIAAGLTATGGPLTADESAQFGTAEPFVTVNATGETKVSPRLARMRQKRRPRPLARRVKVPAITRARSRAPRRHRAAGTKTAASRAGPNGDSDEPAPLTAAVTDISNDERGSARHDGVVPMRGNLVRFPLRAIQAVLVLREGDEWLAVCGDFGWSFATLAEARAEARWLSRNRGGLPIRLVGRVP